MSWSECCECICSIILQHIHVSKVKPIIGKYQVHDHILEQVNCAKYLGIYIDSKLAFNTHVDAIGKKANSTRAFLARTIEQ